MMKKKGLRQYIFHHFFMASLFPLLVVQLALLILFFAVSDYNQRISSQTLERESLLHLVQIAESQSRKVSEQLLAVSNLASIVQSETERLFENPGDYNFPSSIQHYAFSDQGVYYKTVNDSNCSLFYSKISKIGPDQKFKAVMTETLDPLYNAILNANETVVAVYFNTHDSMNRYCPFIDKVYEQFPSEMNIPAFNFYYLADDEHNPRRKPVWTETYLDPAGQGWMVSCIAPIHNLEFLEGVIGMDITIKKFMDMVLDISLPWNSNVFIVDSLGTIMVMQPELEPVLGLKELREYAYTGAVELDTFKPDEFNLYKSGNPDIVHAATALLSGSVDQTELKIEDRPYFITQAGVPETGWKIMLVTPKWNIFRPIWLVKMQNRKIGYLAIGSMVVFYSLFFLFIVKNAKRIANRISAPVISVSKASRYISESLYDVDLQQTGIDELDALSESFENMAKDLKELHAFLDRERVNAEVANRTKSEFLANISHELRTPLNAIIGFSEIIMNESIGELNAEQNEYMGYIYNSGKNLSLIINDILELSKMKFGAMDLNHSAFNIHELLIKLINLFKEKAKVKGLDVRLSMDENLPQIVFGDAQKYNQVLYNLMTNAIKFTETGTITVHVETESPCGEADFFISTSVSDTGSGISEEKQNTIFDAFTQGDGSSTRKHGGVGLGLSICKEIVDRVGGTISVETQVDLGSTFTFTMHFSSSDESHQ